MARHLAKSQLDFKLIEAQATFGGRIQSTDLSRFMKKRFWRDACVAQLGKLFGEAALSLTSTHYADWASNAFRASAADVSEPSQHAHFDQA
ncbi:MAG: hypothetical protein V7745_08385, partial [Pseudomonadales bacterium]